jgi:hypothetical protein
MKSPLFPDGFLINALHSHPSVRQQEPPPSFLSPHALHSSLLPSAFGTGQGNPWGWEVPRTTLTDIGSCSLFLPGILSWVSPSTCWRAALCISSFGSQPCLLWALGTKPSLSPFQSFLPKLRAHLLLLVARTESQDELCSGRFRFPWLPYS